MMLTVFGLAAAACSRSPLKSARRFGESVGAGGVPSAALMSVQGMVSRSRWAPCDVAIEIILFNCVLSACRKAGSMMLVHCPWIKVPWVSSWPARKSTRSPGRVNSTARASRTGHRSERGVATLRALGNGKPKRGGVGGDARADHQTAPEDRTVGDGGPLGGGGLE